MVDDIHYRRRHNFTNPAPRPNPPRNPLPQQPIQQQPAPTYPPRPRNGNGNNMPQPMELGNIRLRRLTDEERRQLRASGSCFKCHLQGHHANECPTRFQNPAPPMQPWPNLPPCPGRHHLNNVEVPSFQPGNANCQ